MSYPPDSSSKIYFVGTLKNRLIETALLSTQTYFKMNNNTIITIMTFCSSEDMTDTYILLSYFQTTASCIVIVAETVRRK